MISMLIALCILLQFARAIRLIHRDVPQVVLDAAATTTDVAASTTYLPLDHSAATPSATVFPIRYFLKSDWYKRGGPVFLYDGGEGRAYNNLIRSTSDTDYDDLSFFERFLKDHGGLGIVWEHRYYGESLPKGLDLTQSKEEDFKYLTTDQALRDVVELAKTFRSTEMQFDKIDLTSKKTPWIFIGGSYPGVRAALMRVAYPDTIFASYAASAPVEAKVDMSTYWGPIFLGLKGKGFQNCADSLHQAIVGIDSRLTKGGEQAYSVQKQFYGCRNSALTNDNLGQVMSGAFGTFQSFDLGPDYTGRPGIGAMCAAVTSSARDDQDCPGLKGVDLSICRLASWPDFAKQSGWVKSDATCQKPAPPVSFDCWAYDEVDNISWKWQYCTEWGYWQVGNPGSNQLVSKYYDLNHFQKKCLCQFKPSGNGTRIVPNEPKVKELNKRYGGFTMRPARTFWTTGEFDPWATLAPLKTDNTTIPDCDTPNKPETPLFGKVLKNKQHCGDFNNDADSREAHKLFSAALKKWLCCFTKKNKDNLNNGAKEVLCPSG